MHNRCLALTLCLAAVSMTLCASASAGPAETPDPGKILSAVDQILYPQTAFHLTDTLTEYVNGEPRNRMALRVFSKLDTATGQFNNLVRYLEPDRDRGKLVLFNGSDLWFYDPSSSESVRISPQQRLIGEAANGDVATVNLARDYGASLVGAESLSDADHVNRNCWHLNLAPRTSSAVYARIELWVEQQTMRPVKARFYAESGRALKIAYYHHYTAEVGAERPTEIVLIDAVDKNLVTTLNTSDYGLQTIPDSWFQRGFLPRVPLN
jgi:hypothetical protein